MSLGDKSQISNARNSWEKEIPLSFTEVQDLANAWNQLDETIKQASFGKKNSKGSSKGDELEVHEMFHKMCHSNHWRPIIAQENKYAVVLRERERFGRVLLARVQAAQRIEFEDFIRKEFDEFSKKTMSTKRSISAEYEEEDVDFLADEGDSRYKTFVFLNEEKLNIFSCADVVFL